MSPPRARLVQEVSELVGGAIRVVDPRSGWPAVVDVVVGKVTIPVSLHVGTVGLSHRDRDDVERRYQNPASCDPIIALPGTRPMLLGLWSHEGQHVLVVHDALRRLGHSGTRVSFFVGLAALQTAASTGWAEHLSTTGERIIAFAAPFFPVFAELFSNGVTPSEQATQRLLQTAEASAGDQASIERARRATSVLVRDAKFRSLVIGAYDGACAMCGLGLGIVQGAHIYPASAPSSTDDVRNGLALCPNHHAAFDRHLVWIEPGTLRVVHHPEVEALAATSEIASSFIASTATSLRPPRTNAELPSDEMLHARYAYFADAYSWMKKG